MKKLSLWIPVLSLLVLGACQSPTATPDAETPEAVPTEESPVEVIEEPTATPIPPTEASQPAPPDDQGPDIAATVIALQDSRVLESHESPDGQWRVDILVYDCIETGPDTENALDQLVLVDLSDDSETMVDGQPLYCGGLGAFGLGGRFWSEDSRYFYYTNAREGQPDGGIIPWQQPLFRLDIVSGTKEGLGAGTLSPDGALYATWNGPSLEVWDINTGEMTPLFGLPVDQTPFMIVWSPDGESFAYLYAQFANGNPLEGTSYVGLADRESMSFELLLESQSPSFSAMSWDDPDQLTFQDWEGGSWLYSFSTGELGQ